MDQNKKIDVAHQYLLAVCATRVIAALTASLLQEMARIGVHFSDQQYEDAKDELEQKVFFYKLMSCTTAWETASAATLAAMEVAEELSSIKELPEQAKQNLQIATIDAVAKAVQKMRDEAQKSASKPPTTPLSELN